MTLLEILAAIGVLSVGLLGLAALLPAGRYTLSEATKADRAGQCGRAALRNVIVRRMLDYHYWYDAKQNRFVDDPYYNGGGKWRNKFNGSPWYDQNGNPTANLPSSFIIDPEGTLNGMNLTLGSSASTTTVPRISLAMSRGTVSVANTQPVPNTQPVQYAAACTQALADSIFRASDDLIVPMPEDANLPAGDPRLAPGATRLPIGRPRNLSPTSTPSPFAAPFGISNISKIADNPLDHAGVYSWFLTVTPQPNNPTRFSVSVVVCFNRNLATPNGERAVTVSQFYDTATVNNDPNLVAIGGGSIYLGTMPPNSPTATVRPINDMPGDATAKLPTVAGITLKENDWVALCKPSSSRMATAGLCCWYRVASVGDTNPTDTGQYLTLIGPDWQNAEPGIDKLVALGQNVVGVYTSTIDLDTDPTWAN